MKKLANLFIMVALTWSPETRAENWTFGVGLMPCSEFMAALKDESTDQQFLMMGIGSWAHGFFSATNTIKAADVGKGAESDEIFDLVKAMCALYPELDISGATIEAYLHLRAK